MSPSPKLQINSLLNNSSKDTHEPRLRAANWQDSQASREQVPHQPLPHQQELSAHTPASQYPCIITDQMPSIKRQSEFTYPNRQPPNAQSLSLPSQQPSFNGQEINELPSALQNSSRASVRIAARDSTTPQPQGEHVPALRGAKRLVTGIDEEDAPKPKKARATRAKSNNSTTRKSNKRSDSTQQMSANDLLFTNDHTQTPREPSENISWSGPMTRDLQSTRCMSQRYKNDEFPRCVACTRRWAGDTCRFQGVRYFIRHKQEVVATCFVEMHNATLPKLIYPSKWSEPLTMEDIKTTKSTVATALLPILREEISHIGTRATIYRERETGARTTCDTCITSIFASAWMCRVCGREACADCFDVVREMTQEPVNVSPEELQAWKIKKEAFYNRQPSFLQCTGRNREHRASQFSPVSRFTREELVQAVEEMEKLVSAPESSRISTPPDATKPDPSTPPAAPDHVGTDGIPFHEPKRFDKDKLTEEIFKPMWAKGEPFVVANLQSNFELPWTPGYFIEKHKDQDCVLIECQTDENKRTTVGQFFEMFGQYDTRENKCWKLKDFPPSADFRSMYPELFRDFSNAVPVPNYVRPDGRLNLASHFPTNVLAPDLGPKMYNSFASSTKPGSKGSTRLHMDMADAVNIMTHAEKQPNGEQGCAAWDLFRAQDSPQIREFLMKLSSSNNDPIHSQTHYLDDEMRKQLYDQYGVMSYRIYQTPGQAVFIPAGCAHQVSNLSDCIKIAIDFVSPENVERCAMLTKEFREQNKSRVWKEDVLQLRSMMWFAWVSCCRQEQAHQAQTY